MDNRSIYQQMLEISVPIEHHESDLHVPATQKTQAIINDYEFKSNVQRYIGENQQAWFDIPFAYDPFWERLSA
jgi:hypothetical protein